VFQAEPTAHEQAVPLPDGGSLPFTLYVVDSAETAFGTGAIVFPTADVPLEVLRDGAIANISATMTSSVPITLQGREGLQFTANVQNGQGTLLSRVYHDGATFYQVIAVLIGEVAFDDPQAAAFFDSFRFTADL
jgi:hypothetical protein